MSWDQEQNVGHGTRCPDPEAPAEQVRVWCRHVGIDYDDPDLGKFLRHHHRKGTIGRNWASLFRGWKEHQRERETTRASLASKPRGDGNNFQDQTKEGFTRKVIARLMATGLEHAEASDAFATRIWPKVKEKEASEIYRGASPERALQRAMFDVGQVQIEPEPKSRAELWCERQARPEA